MPGSGHTGRKDKKIGQASISFKHGTPQAPWLPKLTDMQRQWLRHGCHYLHGCWHPPRMHGPHRRLNVRSLLVHVECTVQGPPEPALDTQCTNSFHFAFILHSTSSSLALMCVSDSTLQWLALTSKFSALLSTTTPQHPSPQVNGHIFAHDSHSTSSLCAL